jgi:hypothetical protein
LITVQEILANIQFRSPFHSQIQDLIDFSIYFSRKIRVVDPMRTGRNATLLANVPRGSSVVAAPRLIIDDK